MTAAVLSGGPSTVINLARGTNLLDATRAAGTLLGKRSLLRGLAAHGVISTGWTVLLALVLPGRRPVREGLVAGAVIAALDLGLVGPRYPAIAALDRTPQVLDHLAFGVVVSVVLSSS